MPGKPTLVADLLIRSMRETPERFRVLPAAPVFPAILHLPSAHTFRIGGWLRRTAIIARCGCSSERATVRFSWAETRRIYAAYRGLRARARAARIAAIQEQFDAHFATDLAAERKRRELAQVAALSSAVTKPTVAPVRRPQPEEVA